MKYAMTKLSFSIRESVNVDPKFPFFKICAHREWRGCEYFDVKFQRYENNIMSHYIEIYTEIGNPKEIYDITDRFREKPNYYFFNITQLFKYDYIDKDFHTEGCLIIIDDIHQKELRLKYF